MTQLYAQPYDISATGFYFHNADEFRSKAAKAVNDYGDPVEEFEIQFIDGERIDCAFADAFGVNQANLKTFFELADELGDDAKRRFIVAVGEGGYSFNPDTDSADQFDVDLYEVETLFELAEQFVDEGLFGEVPRELQNYIDLDAVARDLAYDYSMTEIAGDSFAYRCG